MTRYPLTNDYHAPTAFPMKVQAPQLQHHFGKTPLSSTGFTLIELLIVVTIIGILSTIAIPAYNGFIQGANYARAGQEIRLLESEIYDYQVQYGGPPVTLAAINRDTLKDPWGNLYQYSTTPARRFAADLLNDDFDLYSKGKDGLTEDLVHVIGVGGPGSDDLIRGSQGGFLGTGAGWVGDE